MSNSKTIVFKHELFQNPLSWKEWISYFEKKGFICYAPAYPFHDGQALDLRRASRPELGKLSSKHIQDTFEKFLAELPENPMLIGHSMGGLLVQKIIAQNKAVAGICIDSAPPKGIFSLKWSFLIANLPVINPLKGNSVIIPTDKWFRYAFCNTMTMQQTAIEYEKYVVPESRCIPRSGTGKEGHIDFSKPHQPLYFIAGEKNHIISASLNRKNFSAYTDPDSIRNFRIFPGRTHYLCSQDNWQEIAESVKAWINSLNQKRN